MELCSGSKMDNQYTTTIIANVCLMVAGYFGAATPETMRRKGSSE
jgi:hypothetical protein